MDRISGLPQPIQLHILNLLEDKEIARAAVLSKEWRSIVQFRPVLESVQSNILNYLNEEEIARAAVLSKAWRSIVHTRPVFDQRLFRCKCWSDELTKTVSKDLCFMNHVDDFFQKHDRSIPKFSLWTHLHDTKSCSQYLDRWIQQLLEAKVKVLCLSLKQWGPTYGSVFLSETITNLRLGQCDLGQCNHMSMPNLVELSLRYVTLSQDMMDQISSGCPNLEILRLIGCKGFSSICVSGLTRLYEVEFNLGYGSETDVKVVAPMLRVFKVRSSPEVYLLACESTLRTLSLSRVNVTAEGLRDLVSKFLALEELVLAFLDVKSIEIPNQKLLTLEVCHCSYLEKRVRIDAPNLRVLKYYDNNLSFDPVISSISPNCVIKIEIYPLRLYTRINKSDIQSYRDLFLTLSGFSDMKFILEDFNRELIICQVLDENVIKKIYDSETTMFRSADVVRITSDERMADHLFDSRFGQKTISIVSRDQQSNRKFLEVLRKETLKKKEEKPNCCRYKFAKCWRHWLHDAEMIEEETSHWTSRSALFGSIVATGYQTARIKLQRKSYV